MHGNPPETQDAARRFLLDVATDCIDRFGLSKASSQPHGSGTRPELKLRTYAHVLRNEESDFSFVDFGPARPPESRALVGVAGGVRLMMSEQQGRTWIAPPARNHHLGAARALPMVCARTAGTKNRFFGSCLYDAPQEEAGCGEIAIPLRQLAQKA